MFYSFETILNLRFIGIRKRYEHMKTDIRTSVPFSALLLGSGQQRPSESAADPLCNITAAVLYWLGKQILSCSVLLSSHFLAQVIHILTLCPTAAA